MSTALATIPQNLPAHLAHLAGQVSAVNAAAAGGISAGGFAKISIGGSKFHLAIDGEKNLITDPNDPSGQLPRMRLPVVVVSANPNMAKQYYEKSGGQADDVIDDSPPACSSENGIVPDPGVPKPQSNACATCPQNVWGSAISKQSGKPIRACRDMKTLVVFPTDKDEDGASMIETFDPTQFVVPPSALKDWGTYVKELGQKGIPVEAVETYIQFDPTVTYPKPIFQFGRFLDAEEFAAVKKRQAEDAAEIERVAMPRTAGKIAAAPAPVAPGSQPVTAPAPASQAPAAPAQTAPAAAAPTVPAAGAPVAQTTAPAARVAAPAAPAGSSNPLTKRRGRPSNTSKAAAAQGAPTVAAGSPAPTVSAPVTAPAVAAPLPAGSAENMLLSPYAMLPAHVQPAVEAVGGLTSEAGKALFLQLGGQPHTLADFLKPQAPIDPLAGQPAHVVAAVNAAGGINSVGGKAVFAALVPGAAAPAAAAPQGPAVAPATQVQAPAPAATGEVNELDSLISGMMGGK